LPILNTVGFQEKLRRISHHLLALPTTADKDM